MPWLYPERRGAEWKHGWKDQVLSSLALPPLPLMAIFAIVVLFLSLSSYVDFKVQARRAEVGLRLALILVPVAIFFAVRYMFVDGRFAVRLPGDNQQDIHRAGSSPWGVAALLVVLLLMISYQSSFHSQWFRPLWRSNYN